MNDTIRLRFTLAYQGTDFAGWQYQPEGRGRSVQAELEKAVSRLAGTNIRVQGASRTDAGVHALCQAAHADVPASRAHLPWLRALNAILPRDVAVTEARIAEPGFHARYCATSKTYTYTLWHEQDFLLPQRPGIHRRPRLRRLPERRHGRVRYGAHRGRHRARTWADSLRERLVRDRAGLPQADGQEHHGLPRGRGQG